MPRSTGTEGAQNRVVVVGAGVAGLAAAARLAESGFQVTVLEPAATVGGLAGGFQVGGTWVEKYYHHLFRSDAVAQRWIRTVGLGDDLEYLPASMGFYTAGRMHRFGTAVSLLRFDPLPLPDRLRLGLRIRSLSAAGSPLAFDGVTALDWLRARAGRHELEVFWRPLLEAKFSSESELVSMAWLWARFRARAGGSHGGVERLGYLRGGFQRFNEALAVHARNRGVVLRLGCGVRDISVSSGSVRSVTASDGESIPADAVVWTPSLTGLIDRVPQVSAAFRSACGQIRYHAAVVVVVELSESVLPYYWVTVADARLPFTVAVEHTRLVGREDYGNRVIVYLGRYVAPGDDLLSAQADEVRDAFLRAAADAFHPAFAHPLAAHVFRAPAAQPIIRPGWARSRPRPETGVHGLYAANMAQIYPWDRGINYSLELGEGVASMIGMRPTTVQRQAA